MFDQAKVGKEWRRGMTMRYEYTSTRPATRLIGGPLDRESIPGHRESGEIIRLPDPEGVSLQMQSDQTPPSLTGLPIVVYDVIAPGLAVLHAYSHKARAHYARVEVAMGSVTPAEEAVLLLAERWLPRGVVMSSAVGIEDVERTATRLVTVFGVSVSQLD